MVIFYRGAGVGTYWHDHNARETGFTPKNGLALHSIDRLIQHIARANLDSPYISLTLSYGVAHSYAVDFGRAPPSEFDPAFIYEIEITDGDEIRLLDPIQELARAAPRPPAAIPYHHDGDPEFILGVVSPDRMRTYLTRPVMQPPPRAGTPRPANLSLELETLVRSLRDAEILVVGDVPDSVVRNRYPVW